jgi:hypothetical protein
MPWQFSNLGFDKDIPQHNSYLPPSAPFPSLLKGAVSAFNFKKAMGAVSLNVDKESAVALVTVFFK